MSDKALHQQRADTIARNQAQRQETARLAQAFSTMRAAQRAAEAAHATGNTTTQAV
jgi:hypothetical protein